MRNNAYLRPNIPNNAMKKFCLLCAVLLTGLTAATAQTPNYELAERFSAKKTAQMVFSTAVEPEWFKNGDRFWYTWQTPQGTEYYIVDPVSKTKVKAFDMEVLAMQISEITKEPFDAAHLPLESIRLKDDTYFTFSVKSSEMVAKKDGQGKEKKTYHFRYDIASAALSEVSEADTEKDLPEWASVSPDGTRAVYAKNRDLYWMSFADLEKLAENEKDSTVTDHRLTFDGTDECYYGDGNYRAAEVRDTSERRHADILWSPDSKHFAVYKYDMRGVKDLWVINALADPRPTLQRYKYQMPGEPAPVNHLLVCNVEEASFKEYRTVAYKDQDEEFLAAPGKNADRYARWEPATWLGDNERFYLIRRSRDLKRTDLCMVELSADTARTVIHEELNTYVETIEPRIVSNGNEIIWWSERTGWAQLYRYGTDGTLKNAVTTGAYHVDKILSVDEASKTICFLAMGVDKDENPYNGHVYRIGFDGSGFKRLDETGFNASGTSFSDDSKFFVNNFSNVNSTPQNALFDRSGRKVMQLEDADLSRLFAAGYRFPEPFKVKAADGVTDLYGYMYKPFDFDSTKVYPILDYVYPGPQVEGNYEAWSNRFTRTDRLAQIGFIVITVGNRGGHPNRSKWYHNYGYGNLRDYGLEDQKYAIQQLAARCPFIDINRVGIHGHSGGGFMSTAAILTYPDFFKVAVSCAGNHDNSIYNRWWSEQHHGILEEITEKGDTVFHYSIKTNQELAPRLKGHLLLVSGDIDDNVNPANTIRVVNALIRANKRFDMLILPGQRHGFGDMNEYFFWRMADYYSEWFLGASHRGEVDIEELNND